MIYQAQERLPEAVAELKRVVELDAVMQSADLDSHLAILGEMEAELAAQKE